MEEKGSSGPGCFSAFMLFALLYLLVAWIVNAEQRINRIEKRLSLKPVEVQWPGFEGNGK